MSQPFSLDKTDGLHIAKVAGYTCASAVVVAALSLLKIVNVPPEYAFLVPLVNTLLVAAESYLFNKQKAEVPDAVTPNT